MTDDTTSTGTGTETPPTGATPDETFAWTAEPEMGSGPSGQAREWLTQLQSMIENLATQENGPQNAVTLTLNQATGLTGTLSGGSSVPSHGVAALTNLTVDQTDIGYTLTASYKSATTATSAPFSVYLTTNTCGGACTISQFNVDKNLPFDFAIDSIGFY